MRTASQMSAAVVNGSRARDGRRSRATAGRSSSSCVRVRGLLVQRQAGVEPGARVVVGVDVGQRVGRQVEDQHLDPEQQPEAGEDHGQHAEAASEPGPGREWGVADGRAHVPSIGAAQDPIPLDRGPADWAFRTGRRGAGPGATLHRPCVSPCSYTGSPSPSGWCSSRTFRTRPTRIRPTTSMSPRTSTPGQGFNVDFIWIFAEVGGEHPGRPGPADPVERALDAARLDRPGAVPGDLRRRGLGGGAPVRADRRASRRRSPGRSRATPARARSVAVGAGDPDRGPAAVGRLPGPARQLLAVPAAGPRLALAGAPAACAGSGRAFVGAGLLAGPGDAVAQ